MKGGMEHVGAGHVGDGLNGVFCNSILVVSANATEMQGLTKACAMLAKLSRAKNSVIRVVLLDGDSNIGGFRF